MCCQELSLVLGSVILSSVLAGGVTPRPGISEQRWGKELETCDLLPVPLLLLFGTAGHS